MSTSMQLTAQDIMQTDLVTARPTEPLRDLERRLVDRDVGGVPVVDAEGKLAGVITRSDFVRVPAVLESLERYIESRMNEIGPGNTPAAGESHAHDGMLDMPASAAMTAPAFSCKPTDEVSEIASQMLKRHVHRVVVTDECDNPVGMISSLDLVRAFMSV